MNDEFEILLPALRVISFIPFFLFFVSVLYFILSEDKDPHYKNRAVSEYSVPGPDHERLPARVIGGVRVTAYCSGKCCNGKWHGQTALGRSMSYYTEKKIMIAAVDPEVIPLGTWLKYKDRYYLAADTGSKIKGRRIDLLMNDHRSTVEFGVKHNQNIEVMGDENLMSRVLRFFYEPGVFKISYLTDHFFIHRGVKEHVQ